ncbi:hypothetical protein EON83_02965 [bacterium]|nr:MAG: hypothetical protein EON83_02965 [bacterium]
MATETLKPTTYPLDKNDPLARYHRLINDYLLRIPDEGFVDHAYGADWVQNHAWCLEAAAPILEMPVAEQLGCIRACARFSDWSRFEWGWSSYKPETEVQMAYEWALNSLCALILTVERQWVAEEIEELVGLPFPYCFQKSELITPIVEEYLRKHLLTESMRGSVEVVREWNARLHRLEHWLSLGAVLGEPLVLHRGEKWADEAIGFIEGQSEEAGEQWRLLLLHCIDSEKAKPSAKWLNVAQGHVDEIGASTFGECFVAWSGHYGKSDSVYELNPAVFKGLVWVASLRPTDSVASSLADIVLACSQPKISENKALSLNLFNACVWSLSKLNNAAAEKRLLELKRDLRGSRLKSVERALQAIAAR